MTKRKALIWACIVLLGLPLGYFARDRLHQPTAREHSAMTLFETYCVPFADGQVVAPEKRLVRLERADGLAWVDSETVMMLRYSDKRCSVSDALRPMNASERHALDTGVIGLIERELPALRPDNNHGLDTWDAFLVWESHPRGDDRRWGATYTRFSSDADFETSLSVSYPINDDVSENLRELRNSS